MFSDFRKVFHPTPEEQKARCVFINVNTREIYARYGDCCAICKHHRYVQESPYHDFTTCEYDSSLRFDRGEGSTSHVCDKYEFRGYLFVEKEKKDGR